jgi:putative ABC transport system permease protein
MTYLKYLPLVWAGIWRKRSRAVLMLFQIASAFALFGLLEGFNSGIKQAIAAARGDRLYVGSSVSLGNPLPISVQARITATPGVVAATARSAVPSTYVFNGRKEQVAVLGADAKPFFVVYDEFKASQDAIDALDRTRTGAIVGNAAMQKYGWKVGDRVSFESPLPKIDGSHDWTFDVVGTYERPDDPPSATQLITNFGYINESRLTDRDTTQVYVVKVDAPARASTAIASIDAAFANSDHETRSQAEGDLFASQIQQIGDLDYIARSIIAAVFFALLFATGALMMQSIRERTPELAVLKTVGFSDRLVVGLIVSEAVTFCVFSAGLGLAAASVLLPLARDLVGRVPMPNAVLVVGVIFAVLLGLIGAAVPAWRGMRLEVADALAVR